MNCKPHRQLHLVNLDKTVKKRGVRHHLRIILIAPKAPSVLDQLNPMSGGGIGAVINTMRAVATVV